MDKIQFKFTGDPDDYVCWDISPKVNEIYTFREIKKMYGEGSLMLLPDMFQYDGWEKIKE